MPTTTRRAEPGAGARPSRRADARRANIAAIVLIAAMLIVAVKALAGEVAVRNARLALDHARIGGHDRPPPPDASLPARAALLWALSDGRVAAALPPGRTRSSLIAQADARLAEARSARPGWGAAAVADAYLRSLAGDEAAARDAYARSYREGGFLAESAPWRIGWGLPRWPMLDDATRAHLVDEAAWYSTLTRGYMPVMVALVGHPAEVPVLRERAVLARDAAPAYPVQ